MKIHELKTDPDDFEQLLTRNKNYEVRFNDRNYKSGDYILSRQTKFTGDEMKKGAELRYTGFFALLRISHVQEEHGLHRGWVILSVEILDTGAWR
jgi:hypothetical protein